MSNYFTYLIGWSKLNKWYYGCRYSKKADVNDLWENYFTSSKYVKEFRELNGDPDVVQVRKIFNDADSTRKWESTVLRRLKVVESDKFLNRWDNNMVPILLEGPFPFEFNEVQKKVDASLKLKYGSRGSGSEIIREKVHQTNMRKYGTPYTINLPQVKTKREEKIYTIYNTDNPFKNNQKLQQVMLKKHGVTNMMHTPTVKQKHKKVMEEKDWTVRNNKTKHTNIKKYGVPCLLNTKEIRQKHMRSCPFNCKNNHLFDAGNFSNHMIRVHGWSKDEIKEYKLEN